MELRTNPRSLKQPTSEALDFLMKSSLRQAGYRKVVLHIFFMGTLSLVAVSSYRLEDLIELAHQRFGVVVGVLSYDLRKLTGIT
jgi:hypothetical protein